MRAVEIFTFVLACLSAAIQAQSLTTASRGAQIGLWGGYMSGSVDYGPSADKGYAAGADFTVFPRFVLNPGIAVRGDIADASVVTEKSVLVGPRIEVDLRQRFHPYALFLVGGGEVLFHPLPSPGYTGDRGVIYSYGAGVDMDIAKHFQANVEFDYRMWNLGPNSRVPNSDLTLTPHMLTIGLRYTVPFRARKSQSDFK